jgi:hypothetical protein
MELVVASPSASLVFPSDLVYTHPDFDGLIDVISSQIDVQDNIQEQSSSALVVRQEMGYVYAHVARQEMGYMEPALPRPDQNRRHYACVSHNEG